MNNSEAQRKNILEGNISKTVMALSEESIKLISELKKKGYSDEFSVIVGTQLNTTWTANRMRGYLRQVPFVPEEEIADEMLAILSHRDQIREKKEMEFYQQKINEIYRYGLDTGED